MHVNKKPTSLAGFILLIAALLVSTFLLSVGMSSVTENATAQASPAPTAGVPAPGTTGDTTSSAAKVEQPPSPLKGKLIVIDPGHGGSDPGATREKVTEADLTLAIAQKLKLLLEADGAKVVLTREDDSDKELNERTELSNAVKPNIFVSIHINSANNSQADGIETYYYTAQSERLARCLFDHLVAGLAEKANWVHKRSLYVCRNTDAPSTLVEVGYISNKDKRDKLADEKYQQLIAESLRRGIASYFTVKH
jgi:N-acetylmuramoyl-L-alanine amidase